MDTLYTDSAGRVLFWHISDNIEPYVFYGLFVAALTIALYGLINRTQQWTAGRCSVEPKIPFTHRLHTLWHKTLGLSQVNQKRKSSVIHTLILSGVVVLTYTTSLVFLDHTLGLPVFRGLNYLVTSLLADIFGLALIVGTLWAIIRRLTPNSGELYTNTTDLIMLSLLLVLALQGFILEGLRIAGTHDPWALWSPIGWIVSIPLALLPESSLGIAHGILWWIHAVCAFTLIALLPYSRLLHLITAPANIAAQTRARAFGASPYPGDIEAIITNTVDKSLVDGCTGMVTSKDLSQAQRLALDACIACGRCEEVCPAHAAGTKLSPKRLILDLQQHMLSIWQNKNNPHNNNSSTSPTKWLKTIHHWLVQHLLLRPLSQHPDPTALSNQLIAGEVFDSEVFWACTTCAACEDNCPVDIPHLDFIAEARRAMVLNNGVIPRQAGQLLRTIKSHNSAITPIRSRTEWTTGLNVRILNPGDKVDVLYWVGCLTAMDSSKQNIARSIATIFDAANITWGILGNREICSGDPARRLGDELLFQTQAKKVMQVLASISFNTLVTNCPHCLHVFSREYQQINPDFGSEIQFMHHSEFIETLLEDHKLVLESPNHNSTYTFHDPCYISRIRQSTEKPRKVLKAAYGNAVTEMRLSKENSFCCGGGGGNFWLTPAQKKFPDNKPIETIRASHAIEIDSKTVVTSCPFCKHMLSDGFANLQDIHNIEVHDIAEIVSNSIKTNSKRK